MLEELIITLDETRLDVLKLVQIDLELQQLKTKLEISNEKLKFLEKGQLDNYLTASLLRGTKIPLDKLNKLKQILSKN